MATYKLDKSKLRDFGKRPKPLTPMQQLALRVEKLEKANVFLRSRMHLLETRGHSE